MALADTLKRIATDAAAESEHELSAAARRSAEILATARNDAEKHRERTLDSAQRDSASRAATIVASARLAARDRALSAKHELVDSALADVVRSIESGPAERYVSFIASGIVRSARDGDTVAIASADVSHMAAVQAAVRAAAPDLKLEWTTEAAPVGKGVVIQGSRTRVEVTAASVVDERRDELELAIAAQLFSREGL